MDARGNLVLQRDALRLAILQYAYEQSGGQLLYALHSNTLLANIKTRFRVSSDECHNALDYLRCEKLLKPVSSEEVCITHAGIVEVESTIREPARPTAHFLPAVINYITVHGGQVGSI